MVDDQKYWHFFWKYDFHFLIKLWTVELVFCDEIGLSVVVIKTNYQIGGSLVGLLPQTEFSTAFVSLVVDKGKMRL